MFSTFSTEFSTSSGRKHYTSRNGYRRILEVSGLKCGHSAFYKKESRRFFFCFYSLLRLTGLLFSNLESYPGQFSTNLQGEKPGVENGHKLWFSTPETLLHICALIRLLTTFAATFPRPGEGFSTPERFLIAPNTLASGLTACALSSAPAPALPKGEPSRKVHH